MLVDAMNKYRSIDRLVRRLKRAIAEQQIAVADGWQDDEEAIGFYKPGLPELTAYVATHGQPPGWYDMQLEFPDLGDLGGEVPTTAEDLKLKEVLELLTVHFDLTGVSQAGD